MVRNHPMAWYHDYDGGRAFYTALGHRTESYTEPNYLKHLLGGINMPLAITRVGLFKSENTTVA